MITITCPDCNFTGSKVDFSCSCADEIFCPKCQWEGVLAVDDEESDPEDDDR